MPGVDAPIRGVGGLMPGEGAGIEGVDARPPCVTAPLGELRRLRENKENRQRAKAVCVARGGIRQRAKQARARTKGRRCRPRGGPGHVTRVVERQSPSGFFPQSRARVGSVLRGGWGKSRPAHRD